MKVPHRYVPCGRWTNVLVVMQKTLFFLFIPTKNVDQYALLLFPGIQNVFRAAKKYFSHPETF